VEKILRRKNMRWTPPPRFSKLNFDGASRGNPGKFGASCLVRKENGDLLVASSFSLKEGTCNLAEAQALLEGIKLSVLYGCDSLQVEGDSQITVLAIAKGSALSWHLNFYISNILYWLGKLKKWSINHTYHKPNLAGDLLANSTIDFPDAVKISSNSKDWIGFSKIISDKGKAGLHQLI
ncbi:hypothetical protein KI387_014028, partial [Taxus chinensis]